jgi:SpoVK/Ycf46/Vps4 family AAA+-type ATPase
METTTSSTEFSEELRLYLRAAYPILYVVTHEEDRAINLLEAVLTSDKKLEGRALFIWSLARRLCDAQNRPVTRQPADLGQLLPALKDHKEPAVFALLDFHHHLEAKRHESPLLIRQMRDLVANFKSTYKTLVLISPVLHVPPELEKDVTVLDLTPPDEGELGALVDRMAQSQKDKPNVIISLENGGREKIVKAVCGLTQIEAENALAKVIVDRGRLDPRDVEVLRAEKEQIIRKSQVLEFVRNPETLGALGGLDLLKSWLRTRKGRRADGSEIDCFNEAARRAGVPVPRGLLLVGVPGCGKSRSAEAVATEWEMPLLRFDVGSVFGKFVGEAEQRMRSAIKMAEAVSPCVLWIDELEKAFAGARGPEGDSGVTKRIFGSFLTWMSDKQKAVFVVATANDVASLPPELLRKGRFDETFFVSLPHAQERADILAIHLTKRGRPHAAYNLAALAQATEGFSGAELEALVKNAVIAAFIQCPEARLTDAHLMESARAIKPQALSSDGQKLIALLMEKARDGWRPASTPPPTDAVTGAAFGQSAIPRGGERQF